MYMRSAFVAAVLGIVVGCSSSTTEQPPPPAAHECAAVLAGQWTLVDVKGAAEAGACDGPDRVEATVALDDGLQLWRETYADTTSDDFTFSQFDCRLVELANAEDVATGTRVVYRTLTVQDGALVGRSTVTLYASDDYAANNRKATPLCSLTYATNLTR